MNKITKELISTIAENQPKVKEQGVAQGIEQGKQEVITNSKYIEKQASGKVIRLDDVSEVYHNVVVKADTDTEVEVCGSNLFKTTNSTQGALNATTGNISNSLNYILTTDYIRLASGDYVLSNKVGANLRYIAFYNINKEFISSTWTNRAKTYKFTANEDCYIRIDVEKDGNIAIDNRESFVKEYEFMLELGSIVSPYGEYKGQTITATPSGTEIPSMCPTMTFIADTDVTVDYYRSFGMQTEYDKFWDDLQWNGERTNYASAFGGYSFSFNNFFPKYDIICVGDASRSFYTWRSARTSNMTPGSLKQRLKECGVILDTSQATNVSAMFGYGCFTELPVIDISNVTQSANSSGIFYNDYGYLKTIEKLIVSENTVLGAIAFSQNTALENIVFEGVLASDINLQWSTKLDLESLASLFNCLKNFLADDPDNAHTKTITLSAKSWALLDEYVYENGYNDYVNAQDVVLNVLGWNVA